MKTTVGIDLGSTTTKAVVLGEDGRVLGRGITNSRSNYRVACDVALAEALHNARFGLVAEELARAGLESEQIPPQMKALECVFREGQYRAGLDALQASMERLAEQIHLQALLPAMRTVLAEMRSEAAALFAPGAARKSDFFRDLATARFLPLAEQSVGSRGGNLDRFAGLFDKAILEVENAPPVENEGASFVAATSSLAGGNARMLSQACARALATDLVAECTVGTGYGRATLPFPKEWIRSEILCHGLGAHAMFPGTRTVLDIGGQDTKAIQVDSQGIVTSFQMNDRCAAGCGRYLGYIADEMNLGLHELGPLACSSKRAVKINSTCTVFAGAELRERLSLGEKREDILAGLHRAIILRAMSLLARSGGVHSEFTFTGGVARNPAAIAALGKLVTENYGPMEINISPDSIFTGALGAALFAYREAHKTVEAA